MTMAVAVAMATREVVLPRQGNAMPLCDAEKARCICLTLLVPAQLLNSLPAALRHRAIENALHGALVMVATVAMAIIMAIMAAAATETQEAALLRWGDKMTM